MATNFIPAGPPTTDLQATITGLTPGTDYEIVVYAVTDAGTSQASSTLLASTTGTPPEQVAVPGQVTNLQVASVTAASASLTWLAPVTGGAPTGYIVEYRIAGAAAWTQAPLAASTSTTVAGLSADTAYEFRVTASNATGAGTPSPIAAGRTSAGTPTVQVPGVPQSLAVSAHTSSSISLTWTAATAGDPATSFVIEYGTTASGAWTGAIEVVSSPGTISGLSASTNYNFRVSGKNSAGTGSPSSTVTQSTDAAQVTMTTWNPNDKSSLITLSNSNLTATSAAASGAPTDTATAMMTLFKNLAGHHALSGQFLSHSGNLADMRLPNGIKSATGIDIAMIGGDYWYPTANPSLRNHDANAPLKAWWQAGGLVHLSQHYPNPYNDGDAFTVGMDFSQLLASGTSTNNKLNGMIDWGISGIQDLNTVGCVPVMRLYHEMEGNWFWWGTNPMSNDQYIQLWKYTVDRYRAAGVKVLIFWCTNGNGMNTGRYPGDTYCDIVGWDEYNVNGVSSGAYSNHTAPGKPIMIGEWGPGLSPSDGADERVIVNTLKSNAPGVVAWQQWWDPWDMVRTSNLSAALSDAWVYNRGAFTLPATQAATPAMVRSTQSKSSGKWYFEATAGTVKTGWAAGLATSGASLSATLGSATTSLGIYVGSSDATRVVLNGANLTSYSTPDVSGGVLGVAVDLGAKLLWVTSTAMRRYDTAAQGQTITDANGVVWGINGSAVITVNGTADGTTSNVVQLVYTHGRLWQKNTSGDWYSKAVPSDSWRSDGKTGPVQFLWNNSASADPATGTGGVSISALAAGPWFAAFSDSSGSAASTLNAGTATLGFAVPSGFTAWDTATPTSVPGQVTGVTVTAASTTSLAVTWSAVSGATTYTVQYKASSSATWSTRTAVTGTSDTITGLTAGVSYDVRVFATNSVGNGALSTVVTATTPVTLVVPGAPTALATGVVTTNSVSLTWTAPTSGGAVDNYVVYFRTGTAAFTAGGTPTTTSATVGGLTANTPYDFYVVAKNAAGQGAASATVSKTTLATTETRSWYLQPGSDDSIWNTPFGTGATWSSATDPMTVDLRHANYINCENFGTSDIVSTGSDPTITIVAQYSSDAYVTDKNGAGQRSGSFSYTVHCPNGARSNSGGDYHLSIFDQTQPYKMFHFGFLDPGTTQTSGGSTYQVYNVEVDDASGLCEDTSTGMIGWQFALGVIREWELDPATNPSMEIRHMLRFTLDRSQQIAPPAWDDTTSLAPNGMPYIVWPQTHADFDAPTTYSGHVPVGATIGIPWGTTRPSSITSQGGIMLWNALQRFGAMWRDSGSTGVTFYADRTLENHPRIAEMRADLAKIVPFLSVLTNQTGPASRKGPGARVVAGPPPLDVGQITKTITVTAPSSPTRNAAFTLSGTLSGYSSAPTLEYQDDGGTWQPLSGTGTVPIFADEFDSLSISDNGAVRIGDGTNSAGAIVVQAGSGQTFTTKDGTWSITSGNAVALNGSTTAAGFTSNVAQIVNTGGSNGLVYHENTSGSWYQWAGGGNWTPYGTTSPVGSQAGAWMAHYAFGGSEYTLSYNNEAQYFSYPPRSSYNPFSIVSNQLVIGADTVAHTGSNPFGLPYNAGAMVSCTQTNGAPTPGLWAGQYVYVEWRAKLPKGRGLWPALWLEPLNSPWAGEIDVMEALGHDLTTIYQTVHGTGNSFQDLGPGVFLASPQQIGVPVSDYSQNFHTYGFGWDAQWMTWYVDGVQTGRVATGAPFNNNNSPWYLLMNIAVGGVNSWPGPPDGSTSFPQTMVIDYVRVYPNFAASRSQAPVVTTTTFSFQHPGLSAGTHTVTVRDANAIGANGSRTFTVG